LLSPSKSFSFIKTVLHSFHFKHSVSVQDAGFVRWDHVLNVDESIFSSVHFEKLQGSLDQVSRVAHFSLAVVNLISDVHVLGLEQVHDGEDLSVIWDQCLTDGIRAGDESLQDLEGDGNDFWVSGVEGSFNWNDKLWNNWEDLGSTLFQHIEHTLDSKESVWVHFLPNSLKEDG